MLKVIECLDIELIGRLRQAFLARPMDGRDNFSWQALLTDDGRPAGTGRFYRRGEDLVIDCVAVEPSAPPQYYDLLFRTLLFKAVSLPAARICAAEERTDGFYAAFGFQKKGSEWAVLPKDVVFPSSCKDCPAPCKERQSGPAPEGENR